MHMGTKNEIYQRFSQEYRTAGKGRKSEIITVIVETIRVRRKSVIRRMGHSGSGVRQKLRGRYAGCELVGLRLLAQHSRSMYRPTRCCQRRQA